MNGKLTRCAEFPLSGSNSLDQPIGPDDADRIGGGAQDQRFVRRPDTAQQREGGEHRRDDQQLPGFHADVDNFFIPIQIE